MLWFATAFLIFAFAAIVRGETNVTVRFGDGVYQVPIPAGFEVAPPQADQFRRMLAAGMGTNAQALLVLVTHEDAQQFRAGKEFLCKRALILSGAHGALERIKTDAQFAQMKSFALKQQADLLGRLRANEKKMEATINEAVKRETDVNAGITVGNSTVYPVHDQSPRHWAVSMSITQQLPNETGQGERLVNITTQSYVFFRPKVLQLTAAGGEGDLAWTRQAAKEWTAQVSAANPLRSQ